MSEESVKQALEAADRVLAGGPHLVKVQYYSETTGEESEKAYTYFAEERLSVGELVMVSVRDTRLKARVSAIDVPESEIADFRDKVKTIPAGSSMVIQDGLVKAAQETQIVEAEPVVGLAVKPNLDQAVISLSEQANKYLMYAEGREIFTAGHIEDATKDLSLIANTKKAIEAKRQEYVGPLNAQLKEINAFFKTLTDPITEADKVTRQKVLVYNAEVERQREEAERIENEKFKLAQDEMQLKGEHTVNLTPVDKPAATPDRVRTDVGMSSKMVVWKYEVVNFALLPDEYKLIDNATLNATVKKNHDSKVIPGVRIYPENTLQVRSR